MEITKYLTMNGLECNQFANEEITNKQLLHTKSQQLFDFINKYVNREKAREILMSDVKNIIPTLNDLLEIRNISNINVQHNVLLIMKTLLSVDSSALRKERTHLFLSDEHLIINILLLEENYLINRIKDETVIELFYQVLAKLSSHKKFFLNIKSNEELLLNTLSLVMLWQHKYKILTAIFTYLKNLLKSTKCASILCQKINELETINCKRNLANTIYDTLCNHTSFSYVSIHAIETLAVACRHKEAILSVINYAPLYITLFIKHLEECRLLLSKCLELKDVMKSLRLAYGILGVCLHISFVRSGREHLQHASIVDNLLSFMNTIISENITSEKPQHLDRVFLLSSMVIQRCLEPLPLSLSSHVNPNLFEIPTSNMLSTINECHNICNEFESSDESIEFDYLSSSDHSDSDNDDNVESDRDSTIFDMQNIVSYDQYFPEIRDFNLNFDIASNQTSEIVTNENDINDDEVKSIKKNNIKSWLCCCFPNSAHSCINGNHESSFKQDSANVQHIDMDNCDAFKDSTIKSTETFDVKELMFSAKEEKRKDTFLESADWRQVYSEMALSTKSVQPIIILAEPDLSGNNGNALLEPLEAYEMKDTFKLVRVKLMEHIQERFNKNIDKSIIIYDIESEIALRKDKLQFESRFESGNLRKVVQSANETYTYTLLLNTDINTCSHTQWFYFRISNMKSDVEYTFNIINCEKQSSLYNEGQRPIMFSYNDAIVNDKSFWKRVGYSIAYYRNHYVESNTIESVMRGKTYYTLTFRIKFPYDNDICYLSYNYPYTYTFLKSHIYFWQNCHNASSIYFRHQILCTTLTGNDVPLITITSCKKSQSNREPLYIFLIGRVHPGESNSSWILKGCIDFLLSSKINAQRLRDKFVFKIIPMINPDGVINGCSRTGAQGHDLNRQWMCPNRLLHPTIFHSKSLLQYIHYLSLKSNPLILVDFHGHSRRKNVFLYGCEGKLSWKSSDRKHYCSDKSYLALPLILNSMAPAFSLENCCYTIEKNREQTARITLWRELSLKLSYTLECSQAGCDQGVYNNIHLGINQLIEMGFKFCCALSKLEFAKCSESPQQIAVLPNDLFADAQQSLNKNEDELSNSSDDTDSFK